MKLAVMQPYFFPYLGQFRLMARVDRWVVFDTAQYQRRGWMNRNRVLSEAGGWSYIRVPVHKAPRDTAVSEIRIREQDDWRGALLARLEPYRNRAPRFSETHQLVADCLDQQTNSLAKLNLSVLRRLCETLDVRFDPVVLSETTADPGPEAGPQQRILDIVAALGGSSYYNAPGGKELYDQGVFEAAGIELHFVNYEPIQHATGDLNFEPGLSIIDSLMWCTPESLRAYLTRD